MPTPCHACTWPIEEVVGGLEELWGGNAHHPLLIGPPEGSNGAILGMPVSKVLVETAALSHHRSVTQPVHTAMGGRESLRGVGVHIHETHQLNTERQSGSHYGHLQLSALCKAFNRRRVPLVWP